MLKKITSSILCLGLILPLVAAQPATSILEQKKEAESSLLDRLVVPSMAVSLICLHLITAPDAVRENFLEQLTPGKLACNLVTNYGITALATLAHEGGHAGMRKLLTDKNSIIHFGSNERNKDPLIKLGPINIDSLTPDIGRTEADQINETQQFFTRYQANHPELGNRSFTLEELTQLIHSQEFADYKNSLCTTNQKLLITAAGPICGLIINSILQAIATGTVSLDQITVNQLFNLLVPRNADSDAAIIWRDGLGVPGNVIKTIYAHDPIIHQLSIASITSVCFEIYLAINTAQVPESTPLHSKVLVGLINYYLRGYLRFKA